MVTKYQMYRDQQAECYCEMEEHEKGNFVSVDDYNKIESELAALKQDYAILRDMKDGKNTEIADLLMENGRLREALRELVADSMANDFNEHWDSYKAAIAALKENSDE